MSADVRYADRRDAGRVLASHLRRADLGPDPIVVALPRGGVPVAAEVAAALKAPLDVLVVRKLGVPGQPEFAMGALAAGGVTFLDDRLIDEFRIPSGAIGAVARRETDELQRQEALFRPQRPPLALEGRAVILMDDGVATGATARAAAAALRRAGCGRLTLAVPVGEPARCAALADKVDLLVCPLQPVDFVAVSHAYRRFWPADDAEVLACLGIDGGDAPPPGPRKGGERE